VDDLNDKRIDNNESSGNLLKTQEKLIVEQIATGGPPHSQRAQSLLAIDAGATQKIAALQSGQTVGQVSYWLSKFRREGMGIFPDELLRQTESAPTPPAKLTDQPTPEAKLEKKEKTKKKSKKGKASKKTKKDKKSPAEETKSGYKAKTKKKAKKDKASKKKKKGKKKGKRNQANKPKKGKKKKAKKK
jgi:hypothetical protein